MKVIMYPAMTLDGYIASSDGECYSWIDEDDENVYLSLIEKAGCSIVGKKTFDQYREEFPSKNGSITFVYTHETSIADEDKIKYVSGTPQEVLQKVSSFGFKEIILSGGGEINGIFAANGLVDEIIASVYPLTLGQGIRIFGSYQPKIHLKLVSSTSLPNGIVKNHYKVV